MLSIQVVRDTDLRQNPKSSLNRLCDISDWEAFGTLSNIMRELNEGTYIHRKSWEYALCIHGLRQLGALSEGARAIAVGAGSERPLYYFANTIQEMVATDLYDDTDREGQSSMLTTPERYAPFEYRRDHLVVRAMSGTKLDFEDNSFDFAFTLSSIEHFGTRDDQRQAMHELRRVVKPGSIICVATELIVNGTTHPEYFTPGQLQDVIINTPGLTMVGGDLDLRVSRSLYENPIDLDVEQNRMLSPHVMMKWGEVVWTSVMLFFRKDEDATQPS